MKTTEEREHYLLSQFTIESLPPFEAAVASRYLPEIEEEGGEEEEGEEDEERSIFNYSNICAYVSLIGLLSYICFACFYVFLFGVSLGSNATSMWLSGSFFGVMQAAIVLQPVQVSL